MSGRALPWLAAALALVAIPSLALPFLRTTHQDCVDQHADLLKQYAYREVPERADYAAHVYCRRHGDVPISDLRAR